MRQKYLRILHYEYRYPKNVMRREVPIIYGSKEMKDQAGNPVRADIVIYHDAAACSGRDQGRIRILVECKAPTETEGYNQLVSYIYNTNAEGGVWFNDSGADDGVRYFRRVSEPNNELKPWIGVPRSGETWAALGRRPKDKLLRPRDIKGLLRRCHNRLHGRGNDGEEEDLTMDMVRIILSKAIDEEGSDPLPEFYCTPDEYNSPAGRQGVAGRVHTLFEQVKRSNATVFSPHERITVGDRAICDVVVELQDYQLLTDLSSGHDWDIMGRAYEQYTSLYLKRQAGQYFTNRLAVDFLIQAIDPSYDDIILDPAGGSGGFLTGAMRYVREKVTAGGGSAVSKQRQLGRHRTNLFMIEISKRLVKVAKTAMILNGDGHAGMTAGNSLGPYTDFDRTIVARACRGTPTIILTNPPFAGIGEGRIVAEDTLRRFECGRRWQERDGGFAPTAELAIEGAPPELLFFERCVDWLAPGGQLGIVLPKSFLDTATYRAGREILLRDCQLLAVVTCHKNTFQPYTGTRTCLLILRKLKAGEKLADYPVFMAISRRIGQDSEGVPIFKRDAQNKRTDEIDHDLNELLEAYRAFRRGRLTDSGYHFSVRRSAFDEALRINPQLFLPHLNETLEKIAGLDGRDGWTVTTLGELEAGIRIFKGPRLKSENLIVEEQSPTTEFYYTPSALLQEKGESAKMLDVRLTSKAQQRTIDAIRVHRGDIVISRSGTIGRVSYITKRYDQAIVSDDLIRVRIADETLRHYVFGYLQTRFAQDQMLRNEYGAIQQHLEPEHIRNLLVPLPDDARILRTRAWAVKKAIMTREALEQRNDEALHGLVGELTKAIER